MISSSNKNYRPISDLSERIGLHNDEKGNIQAKLSQKKRYFFVFGSAIIVMMFAATNMSSTLSRKSKVAVESVFHNIALEGTAKATNIVNDANAGTAIDGDFRVSVVIGEGDDSNWKLTLFDDSYIKWIKVYGAGSGSGRLTIKDCSSFIVEVLDVSGNVVPPKGKMICGTRGKLGTIFMKVERGGAYVKVSRGGKQFAMTEVEVEGIIWIY